LYDVFKPFSSHLDREFYLVLFRPKKKRKRERLFRPKKKRKREWNLLNEYGTQ
jgi:hypothetical protein